MEIACLGWCFPLTTPWGNTLTIPWQYTGITLAVPWQYPGRAWQCGISPLLLHFLSISSACAHANGHMRCMLTLSEVHCPLCVNLIVRRLILCKQGTSMNCDGFRFTHSRLVARGVRVAAGVEALLPHGQQVLTVQALHISSHSVHPFL